MSNSSHNPPRPSYSSATTHTDSSGASASNGRRPSNKKENQFVFSHGSKLHAYGRDKAPYPFSYNRDVLELYVVALYSLLRALTFSRQVLHRPHTSPSGQGFSELCRFQRDDSEAMSRPWNWCTSLLFRKIQCTPTFTNAVLLARGLGN